MPLEKFILSIPFFFFNPRIGCLNILASTFGCSLINLSNSYWSFDTNIYGSGVDEAGCKKKKKCNEVSPGTL